MSHEVAAGQELIHSGRRYPAGALAPAGCDVATLSALGVLVEVVEAKTPARPEPEAVRVSARGGFNPEDPATIKHVTIKAMPAALAGVSDLDTLRAMHSAESRKGGRDAIEERIGELEIAG
ncbi:hypothetical protein CMI37_07060 [Candidatus Pacearchaeota archaeon]|nr:hypothetical protein [Candidatus Pacearchaeota archaeon]|tara:strand:+ start:2134 stop:2496 length:363 start_codon:yes stop_codon:yes gene_type:complete